MNNHIIKRLDGISIILLIFIALLVSLFYYLYSVEKNIQNYTANHNNIITLELLNKKLNDFSIAMNQFSNYDKVNDALNKFKTTLDTLEQSLLLQYPDNISMHKKLNRVQSYFQTQKDNIEYFKSLNSSLISGSHFLFDLQSTIADEKKFLQNLKDLLAKHSFIFCAIQQVTT